MGCSWTCSNFQSRYSFQCHLLSSSYLCTIQDRARGTQFCLQATVTQAQKHKYGTHHSQESFVLNSTRNGGERPSIMLCFGLSLGPGKSIWKAGEAWKRTRSKSCRGGGKGPAWEPILQEFPLLCTWVCCCGMESG